mgnify:CR=1 FL=1
MIRGEKQNKVQLMALLPSITNNMSHWQIVKVSLNERDANDLDALIEKLMSIYEHKEGIIYPISNYKVLMLIRLGEVQNFALLKKDIEGKIPDHKCRVIAGKMDKAGLKHVQLDLSEVKFGNDASLFEEREIREHNVIMVAEDDSAVRYSLSKVLEPHGEVIEVEDGQNVVELYEQHNPDILFLDIHLPGISGLELIDKILNVDTDAFIIMMSADSTKKNVLHAVSTGAFGFLAKPVSKDKLMRCLEQCITLTWQDIYA